MDRRRHHHAGEFVTDVVLWRRGRADLSALLLAAAVASWILFHGASGYTYTAVSLAADVLLLLLAVLYAWSRAARLLGPSPTCSRRPTSSPRSSAPASPPPSAASRRASPAPAASSSASPPRRRPAQPRRARPPHLVLRSCGERADDPGGVPEVEHGAVHEAGWRP